MVKTGRIFEYIYLELLILFAYNKTLDNIRQQQKKECQGLTSIIEYEHGMNLSYNPICFDSINDRLDKLRDRLSKSLQDGHSLDLNTLSVKSLLQEYSFDLLSQFYMEHMVPNFPLEDELDSLDDWVYSLDPSSIPKWEYANQGPLMDILLLICNKSSMESSGPMILAGVVFEYYRQAEVGLVSYVTTKSEYHGLGIMSLLHPLAVNALQHLHVHSYKKYKGVSPKHSIRAVFAETNTVDAGDANPKDILTRHEILYKLGYRKLIFPYVQPPLETDGNWFHNTMLLIYQGNLSEKECDEIHSRIVLDYVSDFANSVFGYKEEEAIYKENHYYKLMLWFCHTHKGVQIEKYIPWLDDKALLMEEYKSHRVNHQNHEPKTVVVIGAGVSGLCTALSIAKQASFPIRIHLIEANDYVGGRIRTVFTNHERQYISSDFCAAFQEFKPWPVPLGAEFVHGTNSVLSKLIEENEWVVEETFDFSSPQNCTNSNSFSTRVMKKLDEKNDHIKIFLEDKCWGTTSALKSNERIPKLLQTVKYVWEKICQVSEGEIQCSSLDVSVAEFIQNIMDGDTESDIYIVKSIVDAMFARTAGSTIESYGLLEASREENNWEYYECNFRTENCFGDLILHYLDEIKNVNERFHLETGYAEICLRTSTIVTHIKSKLEKPMVVIANGNDGIPCEKVVVTVPLICLKTNSIRFEDEFALPKEKLEAIKGINMFSGMKVHALFKKGIDVKSTSVFDSTELFFCPGNVFSQIWVRRDHNSVFLAGFVVASDRDILIEKNEEECNAQDLLLQQLRNMAEEAFMNSNNPTCSAFSLFDWSSDEYVGGLYSSPSIGCFLRRKDLRSSLKDTIFFAGEHTNEKTCATVQAAMESGLLAANDVLSTFQNK